MSDADDFLAHVNQLADNAGIELDDDELREIFEESHRGGFNVASTRVAFDNYVAENYEDEDDFEEDDEDDDDDVEEVDDEPETDPRLVHHVTQDIEQLSAEYGRPLTGRETEIIAYGALEQAERYGQVNAEEALDDFYRANPGERRPDTNTQEGRSEFYRQRLEENQPEPEPRDEYDLTTDDGRHAYYDARLNGGLAADDFEDSFSDQTNEEAA